MTKPGIIRLTRLINHPPQRVWLALTTPELHARWWAAGDIKAEVGHRFKLDMGHFGKQDCEVLEVEFEKLLKYTFAPGTLDTTITWRLTPQGEYTLLELEHSGFDLDSPMGKMAYDGMGRGWPGLLDGMQDAIAEDPLA